MGRARLPAVLATVLLMCGCGSGTEGEGDPTASRQSAPEAAGAKTMPSSDARGRNLWVPFVELGAGVTESALANDGTAPAVISVVSDDGGRPSRVRGAGDEGYAVQFPAYDGTLPAPRAVLRVEPAGIDDLAPGGEAFVFGADFRIDARAQGESKLDNGNNLLQRGLAGDPSQFKLEVDKGRPACRIRGVEGEVGVKLDTVVDSDRWYQLRCIRDGATVALTLSTLDGGKATELETGRSTGAIGKLVYSPSLPMSIGGKLRPSGALVTSATDQFNGAVDNVVFDISAEEKAW